MSLSVITFTRHDRPELLKRCIESVAAALPDNATHRIIECYDHFEERRLAAALSDEYTVFVDDDDTVANDSLRICYDTIRKFNVGTVVTDEACVDIDGKEFQRNTNRKTYGGVGIHPRVVHHLCIMRSANVDPDCIKLSKEFSIGMDWWVKASATLTAGAIHVPVIGYNWTRNPLSDTLTRRSCDIYASQMKNMGNMVRQAWPRKDELIPLYTLPA